MNRIPLFTLLVALLGCSRPASLPSAAEAAAAEERPDQESWDVRFSVYESPAGSEGSRPRLELVAAYMAVYERADSTYTVLRSAPDSAATRVTARLFDPEGAPRAEPSAVVYADRIFYYDEDRHFEARGDVVVETSEGKRLESEVLFWYESERKVRTPGFTRLTTPNENIQGYGFVADENLEFYSLARVTGKGTIEEE